MKQYAALSACQCSIKVAREDACCTKQTHSTQLGHYFVSLQPSTSAPYSSFPDLWCITAIMKTSTFIFPASLTLGLSSALPNPLPQGTTTSVQTVTVIPVAAGSPYPASPTTNEFQYLNFDENSNTDTASRTIIHNAFEDWAAVVQKAIDSLANAQDNTYNVWFPNTVTGNKNSVRDFLTGVYSQLFDLNANPAAPLPYVASFTCDNKDYGGLTGEGLCDADTTSYFSRPLGKFHVCQVGLSQTTKATDVQCSGLGDVVSTKMYSLTGTLLHEFMHSQNAGAATPNGG